MMMVSYLLKPKKTQNLKKDTLLENKSRQIPLYLPSLYPKLGNQPKHSRPNNTC